MPDNDRSVGKMMTHQCHQARHPMLGNISVFEREPPGPLATPSPQTLQEHATRQITNPERSFWIHNLHSEKVRYK